MRKTFLKVAALASLLLASTNLAWADTNLTFLIDNNPDTVAAAEALVKAFEEKNPGITIETEQRPGGGEGDNIIKTRLSTGEMTDIFIYNSGSLFQALNPTKTLVDLSGLSAQANILDSFETVVTAEGKVYGIPFGTAMGGGIGLSNVNERLRVIYGASYQLKLSSVPGQGTSARVEIPELGVAERADATV